MNARYQHLLRPLAIAALCIAAALSMAVLPATASARRTAPHRHHARPRHAHRRRHSRRGRRHGSRHNGKKGQKGHGTHSSHAPGRPPRTLVIEGAGDGHGVGMSQWGALGCAEHGWTDAQILAHYYTGTAIGHVSPRRIVKVLVGNRVQRVPIEQYVQGVVTSEMPSSWPAAALEAQAIASRTYAITADAGGSRFDVYSDTRSQVYGGKAAQTPQGNLAVKETRGQIVTYEGKPAITYFFASSGGRTEDVQSAFPGATPEPWLQGVEDPYDGGPMHRWTVRIGFHRAAQMLSGLVDGSFEGIEVLKRGYSPRIVSADVLGSKGKTEVSGPELAGRLGLWSTWAYFSVQEGGNVRREPDASGRPGGGTGGESSEGAAGGESGGSEPSAAAASTGPGGGTTGDPSAVGITGGASAP